MIKQAAIATRETRLTLKMVKQAEVSSVPASITPGASYGDFINTDPSDGFVVPTAATARPPFFLAWLDGELAMGDTISWQVHAAGPTDWHWGYSTLNHLGIYIWLAGSWSDHIFSAECPADTLTITATIVSTGQTFTKVFTITQE